ncbi:MAG: DUF3080 family protein [Ketobacteraceae bacterium]|nr:DUF3080 family protein [Ketobacteraceae bacterium]
MTLTMIAGPGCSDGGIVGTYDDYLTRLGRVLERDPGQWQARVSEGLTLRYPDRRQRRLETEDTRLGVFDFLSLGDCRLLQLVSERNSSLGKVMSATARYHYEWLLLNGIRVCLNNNNSPDTGTSPDTSEDDLQAKLAAIGDIKQQEIYRYYWNATWGSEIFQTFFSLSHLPLGPDEVSGIQPDVTQSFFDYFQALPEPHKAGSVPVDGADSIFGKSQAAERHLQPLQYHYGGRLIRSLVTGTEAISEGTRMLEQAMEARPLCINEMPSRKAEILENVFARFYVRSLQPYLSRLDREAALLLTVTHRYSPRQAPDAAPEVIRFYDTYLNLTEHDALSAMRRAVKQHALVWNRLLRSCGMKVGGNS